MKKYMMMLDAHIEFNSDAETKEDAIADFFQELNYKGKLTKADYDIVEVENDHSTAGGAISE